MTVLFRMPEELGVMALRMLVVPCSGSGHKFLKTSTNADTSDIKMVQFVDFSLNNANRNNLLAQIPQLALQIIGADSHL